jgi:hypothetical protein
MWHASAWQYMLLRPNPKTSCGTGFMKFPFDATLLNQFMQAIVEAIHCQWYFCFNNQAEADLWGLAACTYTPSPAANSLNAWLNSQISTLCVALFPVAHCTYSSHSSRTQ